MPPPRIEHRTHRQPATWTIERKCETSFASSSSGSYQRRVDLSPSQDGPVSDGCGLVLRPKRVDNAPSFRSRRTVSHKISQSRWSPERQLHPYTGSCDRCSGHTIPRCSTDPVTQAETSEEPRKQNQTETQSPESSE